MSRTLDVGDTVVTTGTETLVVIVRDASSSTTSKLKRRVRAFGQLFHVAPYLSVAGRLVGLDGETAHAHNAPVLSVSRKLVTVDLGHRDPFSFIAAEQPTSPRYMITNHPLSGLVHRPVVI